MTMPLMPQQAVDSILEAKRNTWLLRAWDRCDIYDPPAKRTPGSGTPLPAFPSGYTLLGSNRPLRLKGTTHMALVKALSGVVQRGVDYSPEVAWNEVVHDGSTIVITTRSNLRLEVKKVRQPDVFTHKILEVVDE